MGSCCWIASPGLTWTRCGPARRTTTCVEPPFRAPSPGATSRTGSRIGSSNGGWADPSGRSRSARRSHANWWAVAPSTSVLGEGQVAESEVAELTYWIFPPYRRRGYATRAVELACAYAFEILGSERVELYIEPTNVPSLRVAARAGFVQGDLPGEPIRCRDARAGMARFTRARTVREPVGTTRS